MSGQRITESNTESASRQATGGRGVVRVATTGSGSLAASARASAAPSQTDNAVAPKVSDGPDRKSGIAELRLVDSPPLPVFVVGTLAFGIYADKLHGGWWGRLRVTLSATHSIGASGKAIAPIPECVLLKTGASAGIQRREGGRGSSSRQRLRRRIQARIGWSGASAMGSIWRRIQRSVSFGLRSGVLVLLT